MKESFQEKADKISGNWLLHCPDVKHYMHFNVTKRKQLNVAFHPQMVILASQLFCPIKNTKLLIEFIRIQEHSAYNIMSNS